MCQKMKKGYKEKGRESEVVKKFGWAIFKKIEN